MQIEVKSHTLWVCTRSSTYTLRTFHWGLCETPTSQSGGVSDSYLRLGPFLPYQAAYFSLMWGFVSSLITSCFAVFGWCYWEACDFFEQSGGAVDLGKRGKGETWRSGGRVVYSQNVQCKRKIKRKNSHAHLARCFQVKSTTTNNNHNNNTNQCFLIACASVVRYSHPCWPWSSPSLHFYPPFF